MPRRRHDPLLRSRRGVPSLLGITPHDHRPLGVAIRQIEIHQVGVLCSAIDHRSKMFLDGGCYPSEATHSWTDGEFAVPSQLFAGLSEPLTLSVHIERPGMRYPLPPITAIAAQHTAPC